MDIDVEAHSHSAHTHGKGCSHNEPSVTTQQVHATKGDDDMIRRRNVLRRLKVASALCFTFFLVEVTGGILAGSLAILSDAAHLFADLAAFMVAIAASHLATLPPTSTYTFGFKRTEALAALFSMASLALVSIFLAAEGVRRLWPYVQSWVTGEAVAEGDNDVDGRLMSLIALIGVIVNVALAFVLGEHHVHMPGGHDHSHEHEHEHSHSHGHGHNSSCKSEKDSLLGNDKGADKKKYESSTSDVSLEVLHADEIPPPHDHSHAHDEERPKNINLHAAYLHVLGDLAQSVAVLIAGLIIWWKPSWRAVDPICTIVFCIVVFYSTIGVIRSSISVLLEEVPPHVNWDKLYDSISSVRGVSNVHDLHVWSISHGIIALSVHASAENHQQALADIHEVCLKHRVSHSTIQLQPSDLGDDCITCGDGMLHCM